MKLKNLVLAFAVAASFAGCTKATETHTDSTTTHTTEVPVTSVSPVAVASPVATPSAAPMSR
ncbi:MAG: hypothetical protein H7301_08850 [Cryobacterium sp.]|nr:hypothetical protein [Oligoflexia bacterium]